jgi:hypothetical protein
MITTPTPLLATRHDFRPSTPTPKLAYGSVKEGALVVMRAYNALVQQQADLQGLEASNRLARRELAEQMALVFAREMRGPLNADGLPTMRSEFSHCPLSAASDTDTLGTLVGTLVMQRTLDLFRYHFPLLSRVLTDLSDEAGELNQTVNTRRVVVPAVQTYDDTLDTDGRPKGWAIASAGTTVDADITLDELVGVPIPFSLAALSSTQRKLFSEQSEAQAYALVKYFLAKIYALCTAANFNAYATVSATVPIAYPTYAVGLIDFARSHVTKIGAAFDDNEVPEENRTLLLNAQYYAKGTEDPSLVNFFAGQQSPEIITEGRLPMLNNFALVKAPSFPKTNNRVGIALQKNGLLAKSRLPANLADIFPGGGGNGRGVQISDLETGFSMLVTQHVNHTRGYAEQLACAIIGAAKGDTRGGLPITSQ